MKIPTSNIRIMEPLWENKEVDLPASKSVTHRMLILAGTNSGVTRIKKRLLAEDTDLTLKAMSAMGVRSTERDGELVCEGPLGVVSEDTVYLGNSGSSARFLLPFPAFADKPLRFDGDDRLRQRPIQDLLRAMRQLGIRVESHEDFLPVEVFPSDVYGGHITLQDLPSSQVISALMLAAPMMQNDLEIELKGSVPSAPYYKMTAKLMESLGLQVQMGQSTIQVMAKQASVDWNVRIEKDLSAAAYWVVFALISGQPVTLTDVLLPSLQGDERIFEIAESCGGRVELREDRVIVSGELQHGLAIDCKEIPDLVPPLSVLAMFAPESSKLSNIGHLRFKETDRVAAVQKNIETLGGKTAFSNEHLEIFPQKSYSGGLIACENDHRIAMSFALAGTRIHDVVLDDPACVAKSYPQFWTDFDCWEKLGTDN